MHTGYLPSWAARKLLPRSATRHGRPGRSTRPCGRCFPGYPAMTWCWPWMPIPSWTTAGSPRPLTRW